ncbi:hypothetical protein ACVMB0_007687 [Bradyrhizobium sp. USDA 4451]
MFDLLIKQDAFLRYPLSPWHMTCWDDVSFLDMNLRQGSAVTDHV